MLKLLIIGALLVCTGALVSADEVPQLVDWKSVGATADEESISGL